MKHGTVTAAHLDTLEIAAMIRMWSYGDVWIDTIAEQIGVTRHRAARILGGLQEVGLVHNVAVGLNLVLNLSNQWLLTYDGKKLAEHIIED